MSIEQESFDTFQSNAQSTPIGTNPHPSQFQAIPHASEPSSLAHNQEDSSLHPQMTAQTFIHMQQCLKKFDPYLPTNQFSKFTFNQGKPLALFEGQHKEMNRGGEAPQ